MSAHDGSQAPDDGFATDTTRYGFYRRDLKRVIDRHDYGKKPTVFPANDRCISFPGEFGGINLKVKDDLLDTKGHSGA